MVPDRTSECLDEETIAAFVAGGLDPSELPRVEAHIAVCAMCRTIIGDAAYGSNPMTHQAAAVAPAPRSRPWSSFMPDLGTVLADKYRIEAALGQGGMGAVLAARHIELGHRVAIKILHHGGKTSAARLLREAQTCARLANDHIARVFDVGRLPSGEPYIVMEYLAGEDLAHVVARGPLPVGDAVGYVIQACAALVEAHAAGVVHRDLKPANLFLTTRTGGAPLVKVLDFGISKLVGNEDPQAWHALTATGTMMGSPLYMSPEQIRAAPDIDARTDIWSLGIILYELIVGRPPFMAPTFSALSVAIATEWAPSPSSLRSDVPPALGNLIMRCLAKDRAARFASVSELVDALTPFTGSAVVAAPTFAPAGGPPRLVANAAVTAEPSVISQSIEGVPGLPSRRRGAVLAFAGVFAIALVAGAVVLVRASGDSVEPEASASASSPALSEGAFEDARPPVVSSAGPSAADPARAEGSRQTAGTPSGSGSPAGSATRVPANVQRPAKKVRPGRSPGIATSAARGVGPTDTPD